MLGPASTPRAILQSAAPLFAALGFEPAGAIEPAEPAHRGDAAIGRRSRSRCWSRRGASARDPLWRLAVTQAGAAVGVVVPDLQRPPPAHRRRRPALRAALPRVRSRSRDRRPARVRGAAGSIFGARGARRRPRRSAVAARAGRRRRIGTRPASADRCATASSPRRPTSCARSSARRRSARPAVARQLRAGADDRLPHAVPAVRRGARAGAAVASGLPRELQPRRRCATRPSSRRRRPGLWDALRAIARLAHAGCRAGDLRVTPFNGRLFAPARTPLAERRDLDDEAARRAVLALSTRPAPIAPGASASPTATSASSSSAPSTKRCSTTSRASSAAPSSLRARLRRPQGDRHVLHAAADRRLPRAPHARPAGARRGARPDPAAAHRRSGDGQRRVPRRRLPVSWRDAYEAALVRAGGCHAERHRRRRARRRSGGRSPSAVCTASISIRWRCSSRGCRSGWPRWRPIGRSAFSIIVCRSATACSARGSRICGSRRRPRRRRGRPTALPLFGDEAVVATRCARRCRSASRSRRRRTTRSSRCGRRSARSPR